MTRTCTSVLLCVCLQQLERNCCSLTKMQLPTAMAEATWVVLTVTCCPDTFVLTGILVRANAEPTPGFKSLHYQSWPECLRTNFLECLILSFSICKWGELHNKQAWTCCPPLYVISMRNITLVCSWTPICLVKRFLNIHLASLKETPMKGVQLKSCLGDYQLPSHSTLFFG